MEKEVSIQKQDKPFRVQLDELKKHLDYLDSLPDKGWDEP